jgi:hypothetical protein
MIEKNVVLSYKIETFSDNNNFDGYSITIGDEP